MVYNLKEEMENFALSIKDSNADYKAIYGYFVEYINTVGYSKDNIEMKYFLIHEFSRLDIIKSCGYYFENSNAKTKTGIEKYLNAMTKFYKRYMKPNGYENTNLFNIAPFSKLKDEAYEFIKGEKPLEKEVAPPITDNDFKIICDYLNENNKPSIVQREISIIFKLIMLYGLKLERIRNLKKSCFDSRKRLLKLTLSKIDKSNIDCDNVVDITDNNVVVLELPYSLTLEIENYLNSPKCNDSIYMFLKTTNELIDPSFLSDHFDKIKEHLKDNEKNRLTSTGLAKYAILKMLRAGINVPVIKMITGMEDNVISDCTREVYGLDEPKYINRYINSRIREIDTYDDLGKPIFIIEKI